MEGTLNLPEDSKLSGSETEFPFYMVGDTAFPLKPYLMRPFPGKSLTQIKRVFNYRLSRARRVVENAFGILVSRWRILQTTLNSFPENAERIVLATIALHNFVKKSEESSVMYCPDRYTDWEDERGELHTGEWRNEITDTLPNFRFGPNNATRRAFSLRDNLSNYFLNEGAIPSQFNVVTSFIE